MIFKEKLSKDEHELQGTFMLTSENWNLFAKKSTLRPRNRGIEIYGNILVVDHVLKTIRKGKSIIINRELWRQCLGELIEPVQFEQAITTYIS